MAQNLIPVAAYDVGPDGVVPVQGLWPSAEGPVGGYRWLHMDRSDPGAVAWLGEHLPSAAASALTAEETRPRMDVMGDGVVVVLRGVNLNPGAAAEDMVSLRCWLTPHGLVTVRLRRLMATQDLIDALDGGPAPVSPAAALAVIAAGLTARIETVSLELEDQTDAMEEALLDSDTPDPEVARLQHRMIKLRRFIGPQREALARLAALDSPMMDDATRVAFREITNRATRTVEEMDANRDRLAVVQAHVDTKQTAQLARNGYVLSIVAAIFLPLGFLTGLFGVNIAGMPGMEAPWAFAALCMASVGVAVVLFFLFRWLRWF